MNSVQRFFRRSLGLDRRTSARYAVSRPVVLRANGAGAEFAAVSTELSESGILLQLDSCIPCGAAVWLQLELPASRADAGGQALLQASGRVVRVRKLTTDRYETAIEFSSADLTEPERRYKQPAIGG